MLHQNEDGGWSDGNNQSQVFITAIVLNALSGYQRSYDLSVTITAAQNYLLQRAENNQWVETHLSALALLALVNTLDDVSLIVDHLSVLRAQQQDNGSWENDVYSTALALRVLKLSEAPPISAGLTALFGVVVDGQTGLALNLVEINLSGPQTKTLLTLSHGRFQFDDLIAGEYEVSIKSEGYGSVFSKIRLEPGKLKNYGSIELLRKGSSANASIRGKITQAESGLPVEGVLVALDSGEQVVTDNFGEYAFSQLSAGSKVITATLAGYSTATGIAELESGSQSIFSPELSRVEEPLTAVKGQITHAETGEFLSNAIVQISGAGEASVSTDSNGGYLISTIETGEIKIEVTLAGYDTVTTLVHLYPDNVIVFSPQLYPVNTSTDSGNTATVRGRVVDAVNRQTLSNVELELFVSDGETTRVTTENDGRFAINNLSASRLRLLFSLPGYENLEIDLSLSPLTIFDLGEIRLKPVDVDALLPDLTVQSINLSELISHEKTLEISGSLSVDIKNQGTAITQGNFNVIAYHDINQDQYFDETLDILLAQSDIESEIGIGMMQSVTMPLQGSLPYRDAAIQIFVDSKQQVIESRETNNQTSSASQCLNEQGNEMPGLNGFELATDYRIDYFVTHISQQDGPIQLAIDSQDNLYLSEYNSGSVIKLIAGTEDAEPLIQLPAGGPYSLAVDSHDNIIIAADQLYKYAADGRLIWSQFCSENNLSVAIDSDDNIYLGTQEKTICKFNSDGEMERLTTSITPDVITFSADGTLFVNQNETAELYRVDPKTGEVIDLFMEEVISHQMISDANANLYLVTANEPGKDPELIKIDPISKHIESLISQGLHSLAGIAMNGLAEIILTDTENNSLYKLSPEISGSADLTIAQLKFNQTSVTALIGNAGLAPSPSGLMATLYEGDPEADGVAVESIELSTIQAQQAEQIVFSHLNFSGGKNLYVQVDAEQQLSECREDNNSTSITAPDLKADLVVESIDRSALQTDLFSLNVNGNLDIRISNQGLSVVDQPVDIIAYYDEDQNGQYDAEVDKLAGQKQFNQILSIAEQTQIMIPVAVTLPFRDAEIKVWLDSVQQLDELKESNNHDSTTSQCRINPAATSFEPIIKWEWTGSETEAAYDQVMMSPLVAQTSDDNQDGEINQLDNPDIIFVAYGGAGANFGAGILRIIDGQDGTDLVTGPNDPDLRFASYGNLAVGDIDGDGIIEIIGAKQLGGLIAFNHDGSLLWENDISQFSGKWSIGGPVIADIDQDNQPEIIFGTSVFNSDGSLRWEGEKAFAGKNHPYSSVADYYSIAADIDTSSPGMEIIAGPTAYSASGELLWQAAGMTDGYTAIADFDQNGQPEIVLVSRSAVYLLDHEGNKLWGPVSLPGRGNGGAPTVADMDGDGELEIGVAGASLYSVFEKDGQVLWSSRITDFSSSLTGSSVFDFNGDGKVEVVYAGEVFLSVFDGETGVGLFQIRNSSATAMEIPVIADIDKDGHADIIVSANRSRGFNNGIRVFQDAENSWMPTRPIWNQHSYHINNVNDDGSIPQYEQSSWLSHNTYRLNTFLDRDPRLQADISVSQLSIEIIDENQAKLQVRLGNAGTKNINQPIEISFYQGAPEQGGQHLGSLFLDQLNAGDYQDRTIEITQALLAESDIYVVADLGQTLSECDETNNRMQLAFRQIPQRAVLEISSDQSDYHADEQAGFETQISNNGILPASYQIILQIKDDEGSLVEEIDLGITERLAPGETATIGYAWSTANYIAGSYRVEANVYDSNQQHIGESLSQFNIQASSGSNALASLRSRSDQIIYPTTATAELNHNIRNLASNQIIENAQLVVSISDPEGEAVFEETRLMPALYSQSVQTISSLYRFEQANVGIYQVNTQLRDETNQILASDQTQFQIQAQLLENINTETEPERTELEQGQTQICTDRITNDSDQVMTAQVVRQLLVNLDTAETLSSQQQTLHLESHESQSLHREISTAGLAAGEYACILQIQNEAEWISMGYAQFSLIEVPINLQATLDVGTTGRLLILIDEPQPYCDSYQQIVLQTQLTDTVTEETGLRVQLYDETGEMIDEEALSLAVAVMDENPGNQAINLQVEINHLGSVQATISAEQGFYGQYALEISTESLAEPVKSGRIPADCSEWISTNAQFQDWQVVSQESTGMASDPLGPQQQPDLTQQRQVLEQTLQAAGWSYRIVGTAELFEQHLRTGTYQNYLLLSEQVKLSESMQKELREAVYRGEGLIEAGGHDQRHGRIDEALGIRYRGKHASQQGIHLIENTITVMENLTFQTPGKALKAELNGASAIAYYTGESEPNTEMAVSHHPYGQGQSIYMGFDLAAELALETEKPAYTRLLLDALQAIQTDTINAYPSTGYPVSLSLQNKGIATPGRMQLIVPEQVNILDKQDALHTGQTLSWRFELAEQTNIDRTIWLQLPEQPITIHSLIESGTAPDWLIQQQPQLTIQIDDSLTLENLLAEVTAIEDPAYKHVNRYLDNALDEAQATDWQAAQKALLRASDALIGIQTGQSAQIRAQVANVIRQISSKIQ